MMKRLTITLLLCALSQLAQAQTYNKFGPATGILKGATTTYQTTAATASDVVALFSGCFGTDYLGADFACHAAGGGGGSPGGSSTQLQYNNAGAFGGISNFTWDSSSGRLTIAAPSYGVPLTVTGVNGTIQAQFTSANGASIGNPDVVISRSGSTINSIGEGPNLTLYDSANGTYSLWQNSGGQTELWQFNGGWNQVFYAGITDGFVMHGATGGDKGAGSINATGVYANGISIAPLSGTTSSLGGGALLAGACASTTVSVTGATIAMAVSVSPAGGTDPGDGNYWNGFVSATNTVTVKVCATIAGTPTATTYNVRVFP